MKLKYFLAGLSAFALTCTLCACSEESTIKEENQTVEEQEVVETAVLAPAEETSSTIHRPRRETTMPMGEEGTWTVFVYLCGSDLETERYMASVDIDEMMNASTSEKVRYVIQTGGADSWFYSDTIKSNLSQRFVIQDGTISEVWSDTAKNMGESETLSDFLKWGISEYPAGNMGLILWNHGGGSINGVCFDESNNRDSLLLKEVDASLYSVYDQMTEPFEFIGFDACLMATAETASLMATHANYMVASQESEPGYGWDYTALGNYLGEHPSCDGKEIGKIICDSFYESCKSIDSEDLATLSVIDLSKIDSFIEAFDSYSEELYNLTENEADFSNVARNISSAENFGGNNRLSGYTNMVDLEGILKAGEGQCASSGTAKSKLSDAIVYKVNGASHKDSCGLSMYYPLQVQDGSTELSIFKDICLSSYYLGLVDKIAYGAVNSGNISNYNNSAVLDMFDNDFSNSDYTQNNSTLEYLLSLDNHWSYTDDFTAGENSQVTFIDGPTFDEDGIYYFTLSPETLYNTDYVEAIVYYLDVETEEIWELGFTGEIYEDWENGIFSDNFDGYWFCLPDEQFLAAYLYEECDDYDIYISPILLNDEETYLRFTYDEETLEVTILDVWDGQDENGAVSRTNRELNAGDIIVPMYQTYDLNSDDEYYYYGEEYTYTGDNDLYFTELPIGEYLYSFCINDIYGNYYTTDPINFTIEDDGISFDTIE